jgi:ribosomal protein S15P/S13E
MMTADTVEKYVTNFMIHSQTTNLKQLLISHLQSNQKDDKSEQALQILGHVVAESYVNKL